jgi:hypothetical protein
MNKPKITVKNFIDGNFLLKKGFIGWLPVILFSVILIIFYITNRYNIEKTVKEIDKLEKEVEYLQKKHSEQRGGYQKQTQMLELEKVLSQKGIKVSREDQKQVILIEKKETENKQ